MRGRQNIIRSQHQSGSFDLCFRRERDVNGHLIAIEIGVEGGADQRMNLDGFAFNQYGLERLNTQAVKSRGAVQQNRVVFNDLFQNVPNDRILLFHQFFGLLDGGAMSALFQAVVDKRLEQLKRHLLW